MDRRSPWTPTADALHIVPNQRRQKPHSLASAKPAANTKFQRVKNDKDRCSIALSVGHALSGKGEQPLQRAKIGSHP